MSRGRILLRVLGAFVALLIIVAGGAYYWFLAPLINDQGGVSGPLLAARQAVTDQQTEEASYYYDYALIQAPDDPLIRREAFTAFLANGDMELATVLARQLTQDPEVTQEAHLVLTVSALMESDWEAARQHLRGFPDGPASRLFVPVINAWIDYGSTGAVTPAQLKSLLDPGPVLAVTSHQAALLYVLTQDNAGAEQAFQKGVQSGAMMNSGFALDFAQFMASIGNQDRVALLYDMVGQAMPDNPDVHLALAHYKSGKTPPAFSKNISEHLAAGFLSFAESLRRDGHSRFARTYVQLALFLDPTPAGRLLLADLAADQEQWMVAAGLYAAVEGEPVHRRIAQIRRAEMIEQAGDLDTALAVIQPLAQDYPHDEVVQLALADLYRRAENFEDAAPIYARTLEIMSAARDDRDVPWGVLFSLAMCQERLGQWHDAERNLLRVRELSGGSPLVLNYLAYSWIDRGVRLKDAQKLIEDVVRKEPRNGFYIDSLGWLYFKLGEYERALTFIERASALEPVDPVITDHLGDVLWSLNRRSEARYQWRKALAFEPEPREFKKIETKLLHGLPPLGRGGASI